MNKLHESLTPDNMKKIVCLKDQSKSIECMSELNNNSNFQLIVVKEVIKINGPIIITALTYAVYMLIICIRFNHCKRNILIS